MCLEYLGVGEVESAIECDSEELHILCLNKRYIEVHEAFYGRREEGKFSSPASLQFQLFYLPSDSKQICAARFFCAFIILLQLLSPIEFKFSQICYFVYLWGIAK